MKISNIIGREIYDSRGLPTIECDLILDNEVVITASVPSGTSKSSFEVAELRDGGKRVMGQGVLKAIENLETIIAPALVGKEPDIVSMDLKMIEMDGTENKSNIGANAMLAASMAVCRAQALVHEMELYEFIAMVCDFEAVTLPFPMFNMINGGSHANNDLRIQEFMVIPIGAQSFRGSIEAGVTIYQHLKELLIEQDKSTAVGLEGGFAPDLEDDQEALDLLMEAVDRSGIDSGDVVFALDVAATQFYNKTKKKYDWKGQWVTSQELIAIYKDIAQHYPIYSIEDGLADTDLKGWKELMDTLGEKIQLIGDDLFATHAEHIVTGIENNLAHGVIIKPNQVGTVTETLQAVKLCKANDVAIIVSHRSGETEDSFIADLAVGVSSGQIKAGGCSRGERMAKYNHLLRIEDELTRNLLDV